MARNTFVSVCPSLLSASMSFVEDNALREVRNCACLCVKSLQNPDRVDVEMVQEVCVGRSSVGTLVLHQVALQGLLAGVALLYHPQLR